MKNNIINTLLLLTIGLATIGMCAITCWFVMEYIIEFKSLGFQDLRTYIYSVKK